MTDPSDPRLAAHGLGGPAAPAAFAALDESRETLEAGTALCLSGGGYRAMLFHVGVLWRLNELGVLGGVKRVSAVSGGSITAAVLGMEWDALGWAGPKKVADAAAFQDRIVAPLRKMGRTSIDVSSILWGGVNPSATVSDEVAKQYDKVLFKGRTLQDLVDPAHGPRFVLNATNVKTGSLWRFARPYMADYRVGIVKSPKLPLAQAVTASSAFPPVLSPMRLSLDGLAFEPGVPAGDVPARLRDEAILTDGGVYDNLGLEPVWKRYTTVLISDGGRKMADDPSPGRDWATHSRRLIDLLQHQVSNLRRRTAVGAFADPDDPHKGTYWGIQTDIAKYAATGQLACPHDKTMAIALIPTRLTKLSDVEQERLINWGYAVCDAAMRIHVLKTGAAAPKDFPYPKSGVG